MKKEQLTLCLLNGISSMGYSLIAPLFPPLFKERSLSNLVCSYLISIFCTTNILSALICSYICQKVGQKNFFLVSTLGNSLSMIFYGFIIYISNNKYFLILAFINRTFHGFFSGTVNVICFAITSQINSGKELELSTGYMELSWQIGLTIGPTLIGATFDYIGYSLPFIILGSLSLIGVYYTYYYIFLGDLEQYERKIMLENADNNEEEEIIIVAKNTSENISLLIAIKYIPTIFLVLCIVIQLNNLDFYVPTLVNHLKDQFDISTSKASLFFILATVGSAICTQLITKFTDCYNNFQLMQYGIFFSAFFVLFIPPVSILPQSYILTLIGIFAEGFLSALVNISCFIELTNVGKKLFPDNKNLQQNIPSSLFNLCFYVGDLTEPVIGAWFTKTFNFQASAIFSFVLNVIYGILFGRYFKSEIQKAKKEEIILEKKMANIREND